MVDNPMYARTDDLMAGHRNNFVIGGATMSSSSGSGGSTKYMIRDVAPTHTRFNVLGMDRALDGRLHKQPYTMRPRTPEASRYEPNFMLGPSAAQHGKYESRYTIHPPSPRPTKKTESRHMVRPKLNSGEKKYDTRHMLHPPTPELPRGGFETKYGGGVGGDDKETRTGSLYDAYWHIPRASLWCQNKGCAYDSQHCDDCNWKQKQEDTMSTCSSVNPPPTFTVTDDNYRRPARPPPKWHHCSCGIIFAITTVFSLLVLLLITGFIIYIEMVLKYQTANVTDSM